MKTGHSCSKRGQISWHNASVRKTAVEKLRGSVTWQVSWRCNICDHHHICNIHTHIHTTYKILSLQNNRFKSQWFSVICCVFTICMLCLLHMLCVSVFRLQILLYQQNSQLHELNQIDSFNREDLNSGKIEGDLILCTAMVMLMCHTWHYQCCQLNVFLKFCNIFFFFKIICFHV